VDGADVELLESHRLGDSARETATTRRGGCDGTTQGQRPSNPSRVRGH
jgi:hypothetical protein